MSFLNIMDHEGDQMLLSLKRVDKVKLSRKCGYTVIVLEPIHKDDPPEEILSRTSVGDIWEQIRLRM